MVRSADKEWKKQRNKEQESSNYSRGHIFWHNFIVSGHQSIHVSLHGSDTHFWHSPAVLSQNSSSEQSLLKLHIVTRLSDDLPVPGMAATSAATSAPAADADSLMHSPVHRHKSVSSNVDIIS